MKEGKPDAALPTSNRAAPDAGGTYVSYTATPSNESARPQGVDPSRCRPSARVFRDGQWVSGRYRIERFLAGGGMGEVYAATDFELGERVALKTVRTDRVHETATLARFRREVVYMRRVTHPCVGRIFDVGHAEVQGAHGEERSVLFFTMELLEGEPLDAVVSAQGPLENGLLITVADQILSALEAAHAVGIVHRDLKASNVCLERRRGGDVRAVVMDFGLARALEEPDAIALSVEGAVLGTPSYMAPEQLTGEPITAATDLYALGVLLFELATGELPFVGGTIAETAMMRLATDAPRARSRRGDVDPVLDEVIARCLERDIGKRFARAADVREALRAPSGSISSVPPIGATASGRVRRPRSTFVGAMVVVLLVGLAAALRVGALPSPVSREGAAATSAAPPSSNAGAAMAQAFTPRRRRVVAVLDVANASGLGELDDLPTALAEVLRGEVATSVAVRALDGDEVARLARDLHIPLDVGEVDAATLTRLRGAREVDVVIAGRVAQGGDGRLSVTVSLYDVAIGTKIGEVAQSASPNDLMTVASRLGEPLRQALGVSPDSEPPGERGIAMLPMDPQARRAYVRGLRRIRSLDPQGAVPSLETAIAAESNFPLSHLALHKAYSTTVHQPQSVAEAEAAFRRARTLRREDRLVIEGIYRESRGEWAQAASVYRVMVEFDPENVSAAVALARAEHAMGKGEECLRILEEWQRKAPPVGDDPRLDVQEVSCARFVGQGHRALEAATRATFKARSRGLRSLEAASATLEGEQLGDTGVDLLRAATLLQHGRELHQALGDQAGALAIVRRLMRMQRQRGLHDEAEKLALEALPVIQERGDRFLEASVRNELGHALSVRDQQAALAEYERALAVARTANEATLERATLLNIADLLWSLGRTEKAIANYYTVIAKCRSAGDQVNGTSAELSLGEALIEIGRFGEASKTLSDVRARYVLMGDDDGVAFADHALGDLHRAMGNDAAARAAYEQALAVRDRLGEQTQAGRTRIALAALAVDEGRSADGESFARAALDAFPKDAKPPRPERRSLALAQLARSLDLLGRAPEARAAADEAVAVAATITLRRAPREAIALALARGLVDPTTLDASLEHLRSLEAAPQCWSCRPESLLAQGVLLGRAGRTSEARQSLTAAAKSARQKGASGVHRRAEAALRDLHGTTASVPNGAN